jgi:hypothetical protein
MNRHTHGEPTNWRLTPAEGAALITKRAVRHLMHYSTLSDLLLSTMRRPAADAYPFPCQEVYADGAASGECAIRVTVTPIGDEFDHRMYLVRQHPITDEERREVAENRINRFPDRPA